VISGVEARARRTGRVRCHRALRAAPPSLPRRGPVGRSSRRGGSACRPCS